jgi:drug/metabolite transporter (DMT)-like permease
MPPVWIGLTLAFASALVTNTAYSLEHDAAAALPPLSPRRPFRSVQVLLRDRRWLIAFGTESAGWLMYVAALRLAPLSLVQAVVASGVAVLAFATARGHPSRLARREQVAVVLAIAGLVLLALSLTGTPESDQHPPVIGIIIWLAACGGGAALLIAIPTRFGRAASLGLAAGLLFADGDISAKLVGYGGWWLLALLTLIVAYAVGTSVLQWAYQRGDALTAAGTATMVTNAVPIAAGFVLFGESLPHGTRAALQIAAFACLVVGAVALGHQQPPQATQPAPPAETEAKTLPPRQRPRAAGHPGRPHRVGDLRHRGGRARHRRDGRGQPGHRPGRMGHPAPVLAVRRRYGDQRRGTHHHVPGPPVRARRGHRQDPAEHADAGRIQRTRRRRRRLRHRRRRHPLAGNQQPMIIAYKLGATGKLPDTVGS